MYRQKLAVPIVMLLMGLSCPTFAQEKPKGDSAIGAITPESVGREMFYTYCAVCHGMDAKGNGPAALALKKHPPDLTQLSRKNGGKFPTETVFSVIQGTDLITDHGTRDMPMWGDAFRAVNRDENLAKLKVRNLTAYIASIQQKQ
jgi:mono/diheme cytochrome c family protein